MRIGDWIDGWKIVEDNKLHGRAGEVVIVQRGDDGRCRYVLKIWRKPHGNTVPKTAAGKRAPPRWTGVPKKAIHEEARRMQDAADKGAAKHLARIIASNVWHGRTYFVMEEIEDIAYPPPDEGFREFCVKTFTALDALHQAGFLHCDLTPWHVGWKDGEIAFMDFDNACTLAEAENRKNFSIGTDPYVAQEIRTRGEFSKQSDIYALAMILYERCPDRDRDCFEPVLREALQQDPRKRPASAAVFAERLRTCRPPHHRFKAVVKWTGVVVAAFLAVLGLASLYRDKMVRDRHRLNIQTESDFKTAIADYRRGDYANAVKYLTYVADCCCRRTPQACRMLSDCYRLGLGVEKDMPKSREYAERANTRYPADSRPAGKE